MKSFLGFIVIMVLVIIISYSCIDYYKNNVASDNPEITTAGVTLPSEIEEDQGRIRVIHRLLHDNTYFYILEVNGKEYLTQDAGGFIKISE